MDHQCRMAENVEDVFIVSYARCSEPSCMDLFLLLNDHVSCTLEML
jgi:hypothetical protein